MALPRWCNDTIVIIRPGLKTSRGSAVPDWDNASRHEQKGCSVQPAATGLSQDGRVLGLIDAYTVYCPPETDVQEGDHIEYDGDVYEINGKPRRWKSATGCVSNIILNIERWKG